MNTHTPQSPENKSRAHANQLDEQSTTNEPAFQFQDNRPETLAQRKMQQSIRNSAQLKRADALQAMAGHHLKHQDENYAAQYMAVHKSENSDAGPLKDAAGSQSNEPPIQAFFNTSEFEFARDAFATCYDNALRFKNELTDIQTTYFADVEGRDTLKNNIEAKGRKASGTVCGESFETREWFVDHLNVNPYIIGPGGGNGIDLKKYDLDIEQPVDDPMGEIVEGGSVEIENPLGDAYGEVKSARSTNTFLDGVGSALNDSNANEIIVYAAAGITPALNHQFTRSANDFIIRAGNNNNHGYRARITVKAFDGTITQILTVHDN